MLYKTLKIASCAVLFFIATIVQAANVSTDTINSNEKEPTWELKIHSLDNSKSAFDTSIFSINPEFYITAFPGQIIHKKTSDAFFQSYDRMKVYFHDPHNKTIKEECEITLPPKDRVYRHTCVAFGRSVLVEVSTLVTPSGGERERKWLYKVATE